MPTIAESSIELNTPEISIPEVSAVVASPVAKGIPLRSTLPADEVLDTVTAQANAVSGATPVWKTPSIVGSIFSSKSSASTNPASTFTPGSGVPAEVIDLRVQQTGYKTPLNILESLVTLTFGLWANDPNFAGVQVWFTGYHGNQMPTLMATGRSSPVQFTCDCTGETVTVTAVAYSGSGLTASFLDAPTAQVTLNGINGPPPAPTIFQPLVALAGGAGWQFSWNVINGLTQDVIDGYWIYRSATDTTPVTPNGRLNYIKQPASNIGTLTYTDVISGTYYYWVSAVSVTGIESSLTPAQNDFTTTPSYPTTWTGDANGYAADGNEGTSSAEFLDTEDIPAGTTDTATGTWMGFTNASGPAIAQTLKTMLGYAMSNDNPPASTGYVLLPASTSFSVQYSLDNGTTWTVITQETWGGNGNLSAAPAYFSTSLPTTQDLTQVQVKATSSATSASAIPPPEEGAPTFNRGQGTITLSMYEIRVDIEQESLG